MDWWSQWHLMLIVSYQRKVTMTPMTVRPRESQLRGRSYCEFSYGGHLLRDNNTHGSRFNVSRMTGIHDLLHVFSEPWPNCAILHPMQYIENHVIRGPYCIYVYIHRSSLNERSLYIRSRFLTKLSHFEKKILVFRNRSYNIICQWMKWVK